MVKKGEGNTKEKERKKTQKMCQVAYGICPDHPRCTTPTKVVRWGEVPDVVNHAKLQQNRFRDFGSLSGRNLPFSYA